MSLRNTAIFRHALGAYLSSIPPSAAITACDRRLGTQVAAISESSAGDPIVTVCGLLEAAKGSGTYRIVAQAHIEQGLDPGSGTFELAGAEEVHQFAHGLRFFGLQHRWPRSGLTEPGPVTLCLIWMADWELRD